MDKGKLNFVIDALMFLCLMAMAGLGFLMYYVLPPGRKVWQKYGSNLNLTWLDWDRHDWGDIHLYLAFVLLGLLTLHIILHWQVIVGLCTRLLPDPKLRRRVALVFMVIALLLLYFPFLISPETSERGRGSGLGLGRQRSQMGVMEQRLGQASRTGEKSCPFARGEQARYYPHVSKLAGPLSPRLFGGRGLG